MPRAKSSADWATMSFEAAALCADAGLVMMLRTWRVFAGGPAAQREVERMVGEKVAAGLELAGALASGRVTSPQAATQRALNVYGRRVRGNRRRLG